ncbi:MAG: hypothetical protein AB7K09_20990 [Planctomycetota bacterium]
MAPEPEPRGRSAADAGPKPGRGKMITGLILIVVGAVALALVWDIASSVFEKEGPLAFDLGDFESQPTLDIRKFLESIHQGYSRHVLVQNAEAAPFNSCVLESIGRKDKDYAYLLTSTNEQKLHGEYIKKNELLAGSDDAKTTIEKIITDPPTANTYRIVVITPIEKPRKERVANNLFWASAAWFQGDKAPGFTGVIRPLSSISDDDMRVIVQSKAFSGIRHDEKDMMYVLYLDANNDLRGVPPETGTAAICLIVPILFMIGGLTLLFLGLKQAGEMRTRRGGGGGGAGRGSRGRGSRGRGGRGGAPRDDDDNDEDEDEGEDAGPSRRPSARGSARKSGSGRKSGRMR